MRRRRVGPVHLCSAQPNASHTLQHLPCRTADRFAFPHMRCLQVSGLQLGLEALEQCLDGADLSRQLAALEVRGAWPSALRLVDS